MSGPSALAALLALLLATGSCCAAPTGAGTGAAHSTPGVPAVAAPPAASPAPSAGAADSPAANGTATIPVLAPRLSLDAVRGRSVMLHQGADRYGPRLPGADALAGGGGEQDRHGGMRMVCGVVPE